MLITVKAKHIKNANKDFNLAKMCPIALALKETFPTKRPVVLYKYATLFDPETHLSTCVRLPRSAQRFIRKYDEYGKRAVKPFRFRWLAKEYL